MADLFAETGTSKPLRPHQELALAELRDLLRARKRRIVCQMATGAGKTRLAAEIIRSALAKGNRIAFTVPAVSLIDQTVEAFEAEGITEIGVIQANHPRTHFAMPVQVCSVQTLNRRAWPSAEVVIVDEAHIRAKVISEWMDECPNRTFIGLSATPWRRGMAGEWEELITPVRMQELIDAGFLSPFRVYTPSHPDLTGVRTSKGDFDEDDLERIMGDNLLLADVVTSWLKFAEQRPTLVFAVNRAHARKLQAKFRDAGVMMGYCDAYTDRIERKVLFDQMADGKISGIVNVGTLTTGVDADVRCIVLARPTKSEMLFVQIVGRALRTAPGKVDALILDHSDTHLRLGFVTDIHYPALLSGKEKTQTRQEAGEPMPKECSSCGILKPPKVRECPACGFAPMLQSTIEEGEGELVEMRPGKAKAPSQAEKQVFYSGLLAIAQQRGRKDGWVAHSYRKRFNVWPVRLSRVPATPTPEVISWVKAMDIRFSKGTKR